MTNAIASMLNPLPESFLDGETIIIDTYREGRAVLESPLFLSRDPMEPDSEMTTDLESDEHLLDAIYQQILFLDGHAHTQQRLAMDEPLRQKVGTMRAALTRSVQGLLSWYHPLGRMEIKEEFAEPLTILGLAYMMGMDLPEDLTALEPPERTALLSRLSQLATWSNALAALTAGEFSVDAFDHTCAMRDGFHALLETKKSHPHHDLASVLATTEHLSSVAERTVLAMVLFAAGNVTNTTLLTNGLPLLLSDRQQFLRLQEALRSEPGLIRGVVRELLRLITPTQWGARWASEETTIGEKRIPKGGKVLIWFAAMNRDPLDFPNPDRFDPGRPTKPEQAAFSFGIHKCPGLPFALLEAQEALLQLVQLPDLDLAEQDLSWGSGQNQRRYEQVVVQWKSR